jgi:ubiquinone/menaquinone biosynthesis C-methylase UbiE
MKSNYYSKIPLRSKGVFREYFINSEVKIILNFIKKYNKSTVQLLDIGTGIGDNLSFFQDNLEGESVGLDYDYQSLYWGSQGKCSLNLVCGSAQMLPFNDETFDVITCIGLFEMKGSFERYIDEISRVLRCNGILIFTAWNSSAKYNFKFLNRKLLGSVSYSCTDIEFEIKRLDMKILEKTTTFYSPRLIILSMIRVSSILGMGKLFVSLVNKINNVIRKTIYAEKNGMEWIIVVRKI